MTQMSSAIVTMLDEAGATTAERVAVARAAHQVIGFETWTAERNAVRRANRHHRRREADAVRKLRPKPAGKHDCVDEAPSPEGISPAKKDKTTKCGICLAAERRYKAWQRLMKKAQRDKRPAGSPERRDLPFPEDTGDVVLERVAGGRRWAVLASIALMFAREIRGGLPTLEEADEAA